jgi:hypothetical protein
MLMTKNRLRKADWEVRPVNIGVARRMVTKHHYAGGAAARPRRGAGRGGYRRHVPLLRPHILRIGVEYFAFRAS